MLWRGTGMASQAKTALRLADETKSFAFGQIDVLCHTIKSYFDRDVSAAAGQREELVQSIQTLAPVAHDRMHLT